jgi:hypothetical protein
MDLKEFFRLPARSGVAGFAKAQVQLYRHNASLQDYFLPLQLNFGRPCTAKVQLRSFSNRVLGLAQSGSFEVVRRVAARKYKVDVLYCPTPYSSRPTENRLLVSMLMGLAQTDAKILCLLPESSPCRAEIVARLKAEGRSGQVTLLDPMATLNPVASRLLSRVARDRGRAAFATITELLQPLEMAPPLDSLSSYEAIAKFAEAWASLEQSIEFNAVVSRCHWLGLCSPVCRTARLRGKPSITFQQGVIDHTLDVPVNASKYVAFGRSSAAFLTRMNRSFFQAVGKVEPPVDCIPGGSLFDQLLSLPNQYAKCSVLLLDDSDPNGFYGLDLQRRGGMHLARLLLQSGDPPRRVIIRLHPYTINVDLEPWKQLVRDYPYSCELSHTAWTLEDDLARASVVVGNTSGALTVAAASGLPTYFLETDCYATEDLACFRPGQTFPPDDAQREIRRILTDPQAYADARIIALRNAREYYANGENLRLNGAFFERMLRDLPVSDSL